MQTDGDKWELKTWNEKVIKTELSGRSALKGQRYGLGCSGIEGGGGGGGGEWGGEKGEFDKEFEEEEEEEELVEEKEGE